MWASGPAAAGCRFGQQRGQQILDATAALLLEVGYDRLTFDAVAARARASKATLYRYWPTKVELVADALAAVPHPQRELADTGSLAGDLHALLDAVHDSAPGRGLELFTAIGTAARRDDRLAEVARACVLGPVIDDLAVLLRRACERGELPRETDVPFVASVIPAMVMFHTCLSAQQSDPPGLARRVIDEIVLPLSRGAAPSTAGPEPLPAAPV